MYIKWHSLFNSRSTCSGKPEVDNCLTATGEPKNHFRCRCQTSMVWACAAVLPGVRTS